MDAYGHILNRMRYNTASNADMLSPAPTRDVVPGLGRARPSPYGLGNPYGMGCACQYGVQGMQVPGVRAGVGQPPATPSPVPTPSGNDIPWYLNGWFLGAAGIGLIIWMSSAAYKKAA